MGSVSGFQAATSELGTFFGVRNEGLKTLVNGGTTPGSDLSALEQEIINNVFSLFDGSTPGGAFVSEVQLRLLEVMKGASDDEKKIIKKVLGIFSMMFGSGEICSQILSKYSSPTPGKLSTSLNSDVII